MFFKSIPEWDKAKTNAVIKIFLFHVGQNQHYFPVLYFSKSENVDCTSNSCLKNSKKKALVLQNYASKLSASLTILSCATAKPKNSNY